MKFTSVIWETRKTSSLDPGLEKTLKILEPQGTEETTFSAFFNLTNYIQTGSSFTLQ